MRRELRVIGILIEAEIVTLGDREEDEVTGEPWGAQWWTDTVVGVPSPLAYNHITDQCRFC